MKQFLVLLMLLAGFGIWNSIGCSTNPTTAAPVTVINLVTATFTPTGSPTLTPTITATPVPTVPVFTFEGGGSGNLQYWYLNYGVGGSVAVTAIGFGSGTAHSLDLSMTTAGNDGQVQVSNAAVGFPANFANYNATGIICYIRANASAFSGNTQYQVASCPYIKTVQAGPVTTMYGGCYNGWLNQSAQFGPNGTGGTWYTITISPTDATWTANQTNVTAIGVDVNLATAVNTDFYIDNVSLF